MDPYRPLRHKIVLMGYAAKAESTLSKELSRLHCKENLLQYSTSLDGNEVLYHACSKGWYSVSTRLVEEFGLDPNVQNGYGNTALHGACKSSNAELVMQLILSYKCDPHLPNKSHHTPLHNAIQAKRSTVVKALINYGGFDSISDSLKQVNLSIAAIALKYWDEAVIKCFIDESGCGSGILVALLHKCFTGKTYNKLNFILDNYRFDPIINHVGGIFHKYAILPIVCEAINSNDYFDPSILHYLIIDHRWNPGEDSGLVLYTLCNTVLRWKHIDILFELVLKIDPHLFVPTENNREVCTMCFPTPYEFSYASAMCHPQLTFLENVRQLISHGKYIKLSILSEIVNIFAFFYKNVQCQCNFRPVIIDCVKKLYSRATFSLLRQLVKLSFSFECNSIDHLINFETLEKICVTSNETFDISVYFQNPLHSAKLLCCLKPPFSSSIYSLFYDLINTSEFDLKSKADIFGNTLLHLACLFYHGDSTLIEYLLSTGKTDPLCVNDYQQTPLTLLGLSCGATNNAELNIKIQNLIDKFGEMKVSHPIESYVNIVVLGDPGVGKSTLVKVINDRHDVLLRQFRSVTGVELCTAGIVPHILDDKDMGRIILHDLAGQVEYYSSHTAVLGNLLQGSAAVFVIVVSLADERSAESLQFWLSVVENANLKVFKQHSLLVAVSHYDLSVPNKAVKFSTLQNTLSSAKSNSSGMLVHENIFRLDCRKLGGGQLDSLLSSLSSACESVRSKSVKEMSLYCHMLYDFLHSHGKAVYSLNEIVRTIKTTNNLFLPIGDQLVNTIQSLSSTGLIMYLRKADNPAEDLWIIADKAVLLKDLNGVLFAPDDFKEHVDQLVSKTGIVKLSKLSKHCKVCKHSYDPDMIVQFLESMELSHEISRHFFLSSNLAPFSESTFNERYLFIPALIKSTNRPDNTDQFQFGWCLQCSDVHSFFLSLFIHLIILHLLKYTDDRSRDDSTDRHCHIWNNGIYWNRRDGVSALVELFDKHKCCVLLMFCKPGCYEKMTRLRKTVIREILSCQSQVLLKASIKESILDNTGGLQYPQILETFSSVPLYSIHEFSRCYESGNGFVLEHKSGQRMEVNDLLKGTDIMEQCESVLAGRNPKNLSEIGLSSLERNGAAEEVNGFIPSSNSRESTQDRVLSQAQQNSIKPLYPLHTQPSQHPTHSTDPADLSPSYIFNLLQEKASEWDAIGSTLRVDFDKRNSLRRDVSLNDFGRLKRVVNMWAESMSPTLYRDQFITALRNLQYNDVLTTVLNGQLTEVPVSSMTNIPLGDVSKADNLPNRSRQLPYQGHSDTTVNLPVKQDIKAAQDILRGDPKQHLHSTGSQGHSGVCNPIHLSDDSATNSTVYSVLLKYRPQLLGIIGDPNKLAVELVSVGLLSPDTQDRVSTTLGISRYDKANVIMSEIVRYFERHVSDCERFLKFCQVLKDHGQPGLDELAEEMEKMLVMIDSNNADPMHTHHIPDTLIYTHPHPKHKHTETLV